MNDKIIKLALDSNLLNYVDNETPRYYFVSGNAEVEDVEKFAELIIQECAGICEHRYAYMNKDMSEGAFEAMACHDSILEHFGIE